MLGDNVLSNLETRQGMLDLEYNPVIADTTQTSTQASSNASSRQLPI